MLEVFGVQQRQSGLLTGHVSENTCLDVDHVKLVAEVCGRDKSGDAGADQCDHGVDNAVELLRRRWIERVARQACIQCAQARQLTSSIYQSTSSRSAFRAVRGHLIATGMCRRMAKMGHHTADSICHRQHTRGKRPADRQAAPALNDGQKIQRKMVPIIAVMSEFQDAAFFGASDGALDST